MPQFDIKGVARGAWQAVKKVATSRKTKRYAAEKVKTITRYAANSAARKYPLARRIGELLGFTPTMVADHIFHRLENGAGEAMTPSYAEVDNVATGSFTDTRYVVKTSKKTSAAFLKAISLGTRLKLETFNNYRLGSSVNNQAVGDMCYNNYAGQNYALNSCVWGGNSAGYTTTDGCFLALEKMTASATTSTNRLYFDNATVNTVVSNASKTSIIVDMYEVVAKHDVGYGSLSQVTNYYTASPYYYWYVGDSVTKDAGSSTTTISGKLSPITLNDKPFTSQLFNTYWKVCSRVRLTLPAGGGHRHTSSYAIKQIIPGARYLNSSLLAGITRNIMFVIRGVPGYDASVGVQQVATGTSEILVTHEITYKATAFSGNYEISNYDTVVSGIATTAGTSSVTVNDVTSVSDAINNIL